MDTAPAPFSHTQRPESAPIIQGFELLDCIGRGPMASVYWAKHEVDGAIVACKVLAPRRHAGARGSERFLREVKVMKTLRHPRLVSLLDARVSNGRLYLVMPWCAGGNLEDLLRARGGRLGAAEAVGLVAQALEGLAHMHERSFVHRDVKPSNILLDADGSAKLADFGIAKSFVDAGLSDMTSATGTPFGTPAFMALEQVKNYRYVDPATDVWAAAATLYYLLTGVAPREVADSRYPLDAILKGRVVRLRQRGGDVPGGLAKVVDKALSESVEDRYPDAGAFLRALRRAGW